MRQCLLTLVAALSLLARCAGVHESVSHGISRSDRGALKLLYWATEGQSWKAGWDIQNELSDPCLHNWYGISCDDDRQIIAIRLGNNNLQGYIPKEFPRDSLRFLQELDLSSNFLTGPVPATISLFTSLRILRLDRNWLNGVVPASIGSLSFLEYLEIQGNQFAPDSNGFLLPDAVAAIGQTGQCHIIS